MTFRDAAFRAVLLASAAALPLGATAQPAGSPAAQTGTSDVIRVLLDQASYWRSKSENKLADEALARVLALDPGNLDGLALQAQAAADRGDTKVARDALAKLQATRPDDPRIGSIQQALRIGPVDQGALTEARRLAQDGKPQQAIDGYRRVFKGDTPPPSLATEYYQTLGATEGNWEAARDGLATHLRADPQDLTAQLAYAEILTYRDETRSEGVQRLTFLTREAQVSQQAERAWRQALSWLPSTQTSLPKYDEYLAHSPNDSEVQRWRAVALADTGTLRATGFDDLQNNRLSQADAEFTKAISINGNDVDAVIGLALVRFKQNRQPDGRELIRKAIEIDPTKATQYESMLESTPASRTAGNTGGFNGNGRYGNGNGVNYGAIAAWKIRGEYAQVAALTQRGDYAAAERLLRKLMGNRPNAGNYLQLGDIQSRAGRLGEAENSFNTVLRSQPRNVAALGGMANILSRQGKTAEADRLYGQAQSLGGGNALGQNRAQQLRKEALSVADPATRTGLFRAAVAADPANPWLRLELARALLGQGQQSEARQIMAAVTDAPRPSVDQLKAGIYFAESSQDNRLAATLVGRLPPGARTPDMQDVASRAEVAADVQEARSQSNPAAMEQRMIALAAKPDPSGTRGAQFAQELIRAGDKPGAREVIRAALAASRSPTAAQRIAYAGALLGAGYPRDAKVLTAGISASQLNASQRGNLDTVQDNTAVYASDTLNARGQTADALNELTPRLQRQPANPALNMALARVYQAERQPGTAVAITQELLRRNPGDVQVQVAAVSAALAAGQTDRAAALARQLTTEFPQEPQGWFAAAQVARSRGDNGQALSDLRKARDLRTKQLTDNGTSDASDVLVPGWVPGQRYALNWPPNVLNDASPDPAPVAAAEPVTREYERYSPPAATRYAQNTAAPFGGSAPYSGAPGPVSLSPTQDDGPLPQPLSAPPGVGVRAVPVAQESLPATPPASTLGILSTIPQGTLQRSTSAPTLDEPTGGPGRSFSAAPRQPADQLSADIDRSIQQVSETVAPQASGTLSIRGRTGSQGLSNLFDVEAPLEASFSPNGYGRLKVQVTPVYLSSAGSPSNGDRALFGTNPLIVSAVRALLPVSAGFIPNLPGPSSATATGAGLNVSYAYDFATVDVGTTPLGFQQQSVLGGIQFLPRFSNNLALRLTADRRAVTDSVLSYAGLTDSATGQKWGGVTKNRVYANLEGSVGNTYYYAGGGVAAFLGKQVAFNADAEASVGFSTPVWSDANKEVRVGANAVYFGFQRNLGNFTLGNGGYFSPQHYFAFLVPATFKHQVTEDLVYSIQGSVGVQSFHARSEPIFPNHDRYQVALAQLYQSGNSNLFPYNSGFGGTGVAGGLRGDIDYRLTQNLHVGAQAGFDRSGTFTEGTGLVYARYVFNNPQTQ